MRPTAAVVASSVCWLSVYLLFAAMNRAKAAEQIEVPFGMWTRVAQGLGGLKSPRGRRNFGGHTWSCPDLPAVDILNRVH